MMLALHRERTFSELFVAYLLARERTLRRGPGRSALQFQRKEIGSHSVAARALRPGRRAQAVIPKISQETLAEMIGTTPRS